MDGQQGSFHICVINHLGPLKRDLFFSPWNAQLVNFFSWKLSHHQMNAFHYQWMDGDYAFTPFTSVGKVLREIWRDQCTPWWETQSLFPTLQEMLYKSPALPRTHKGLMLDQRNNLHPLEWVLNQTAWPSQGTLPEWLVINRKLWLELCSDRGFDHIPEQIDLIHVAEFLSAQIDCGVSFTVIKCIHISPVSVFD